VRLLLDTHAFLWFALGDAQLSANALQHILAQGWKKLVSPASYWELAIKISLGKYTLHQPFDAFLQRAIAGNGFAILPIEPSHVVRLTTLPHHHRDPFDRLLVAQALEENIPIISNDAALDAYGVQRIW
jgi:PIN domain nuclease of toxin-antitoxin system